MPLIVIEAAHANSAAEMTSAARMPNKNVLSWPINDPNIATPSTLPVCRPATPERD
jgi:hypothetical protein